MYLQKNRNIAKINSLPRDISRAGPVLFIPQWWLNMNTLKTVSGSFSCWRSLTVRHTGFEHRLIMSQSQVVICHIWLVASNMVSRYYANVTFLTRSQKSYFPLVITVLKSNYQYLVIKKKAIHIVFIVVAQTINLCVPETVPLWQKTLFLQSEHTWMRSTWSLTEAQVL